MSFKSFNTTTKKNIDKQGNLIDENIVGRAIAVHMAPFSYMEESRHPISGEVSSMLRTGMATKVCVLWEHERSPSPSFENPEDLTWISIPKEDESVLDDEPYASLSHLNELADEGDEEALNLIANLVGASERKLNEEDEEDGEDAVSESAQDVGERDISQGLNN